MASKYKTAIRTATPFSTWFKITEKGPSATSLSSSTPLLIGPGSMIRDNLSGATVQKLKEDAKSIISGAGFEKIDYVEICDANTLMSLTEFNGKTKSVALTAAFVDGVRLIDNLILN